MSDSLLKKTFQKKDVERIRNLVKGKSGDRVTSGIGQTKSTTEDHKEGDVWEVNGKTWTIKDGIKETIFKAGLDLVLPAELNEIQEAVNELNTASKF